MAYTLHALIARCELFANPPSWSAGSAVIALPQGFCMLPLGDALCGRFGPADRPWLYEPYSIFTHLPEDLVPHLLELSRGGPLAYVEAEYFGGVGEQRWMGWDRGAVVREPEESSGAINSALSWLGVERAAGNDCFDTLGLGRHRSVDDWLADASAPAAPTDPVPSPTRQNPPWWRFWR